MSILRKNKSKTKVSANSHGSAFGLCDDMSFTAAETFKMLSTKIELIFPMPAQEDLPSEADVTPSCKVIGVTSALQGEGKTTTAVNLAYTMAEAGKRVFLLEADMRVPMIGKYLSLQSTPGLSNLLSGQSGIKECQQIYTSKQKIKFQVITGGAIPPFPSELLQSQRMSALIDSLRKFFDYVIVDLPPVNIVADALVVTKYLDGILLVVRQDYCNTAAFQEAMGHLEMADVKIMGTILNCSDGFQGATSYYKK